MKVVGPDMRSYGGFLWPESGYVEAPDWDPQPACGRGLHGWLNGQGDYTCQSFTEIDGAKWLILEVDNFIDLVGKVKFQSCTVVHCGTRQTATNYLLQAGISGPIIGVTISGGDGSTVSGVDGSTVSGGPNSRVSGGDGSTVSGGPNSRVSGGDGSTVSGGTGSVLILRDCNYSPKTATVGENGILPDTPYILKDGVFTRV